MSQIFSDTDFSHILITVNSFLKNILKIKLFFILDVFILEINIIFNLH